MPSAQTGSARAATATAEFTRSHKRGSSGARYCFSTRPVASNLAVALPLLRRRSLQADRSLASSDGRGLSLGFGRRASRGWAP